jgi:hypothetical protein
MKIPKPSQQDPVRHGSAHSDGPLPHLEIRTHKDGKKSVKCYCHPSNTHLVEAYTRFLELNGNSPSTVQKKKEDIDIWVSACLEKGILSKAPSAEEVSLENLYKTHAPEFYAWMAERKNNGKLGQGMWTHASSVIQFLQSSEVVSEKERLWKNYAAMATRAVKEQAKKGPKAKQITMHPHHGAGSDSYDGDE